MAALVACAWSSVAFAQSALEQGENVQETYDLNALGLIVVGRDLASTSDLPWRPVRGKYRWAMTYGEFYDFVGRPELAARQSRRDVTCGILTWGGLAVGIGGGYLLVRSLGSDGFSSGAQVGLGLVLGGTASALIGALMNGAVISSRDAEALVDVYNHSLRHRLQLPQSTQPTIAPFNQRLRLVLAPAMAPEAWGLSLIGRF